MHYYSIITVLNVTYGNNEKFFVTQRLKIMGKI